MRQSTVVEVICGTLSLQIVNPYPVAIFMIKTKKLLTALLFTFWTISSFGEGPSKQLIQLVFSNQFGCESSRSIREMIGMDVQFSGKLASASNGNLMLLLNEPVLWTYLDAEGASQSIQASVFEFDPVEGKITQAYEASPTEVKEDGPSYLELGDLVFDPVRGIYYGLDSKNLILHAFEYGADQEVTVMVKKTRMVEVIVPPDPIEIKPVSVSEPAPATPEVVEPKQVHATTESVVMAAEPEVKVAETEEGTTVSSTGFSFTPADSATETTVEEPISTPDDTAASAEADVQETQPEEAVASETDTSDNAPIVVVPESEKSININPSEVGEILEEVVEPIVPKTKWVEETYEEPTTVIEHHKFGKALSSYEISPLGLISVADLYFDPVSNSMVMLGRDSEGNWILAPFQIAGDKVLSNGKAVNLNIDGLAHCVFADPVTKHWIVIADKSVEMHGRDGRFLRNVSDAVTFSDICSVVTLASDQTPKTTLYTADPSSFGPLSWIRTGETKVHHVPGEFATIQEAINASGNDEWILLSPGMYAENLVVAEKAVNIVSYYQLSEDLYFSENTVIKTDGGVGMTVDGNKNSSAYISGIRFTGADTAIQSSGNLTIENLELIGNQTALLIKEGTAVVSDSEISGNTGDGILYAGAAATLVERCNINSNGGNGIAINITPYEGVLYRTVIRRNTISGNTGSGIYFYDQPIMTQREFRIENNFVLNNGVAGLEVYLEQPDPKNLIPTGPRTRSLVYLVNNTLVGNPVGVLRGGNYRMVNNIIAQSSEAGVKRLLYNSLIIRNLFWKNGADSIESNYNASSNLAEDPLFVGEDYILSVRSPAKKAGIPGNLWNDTSDRSGADIGASR